MTRQLTLSGSYPRRETLVRATWDADKGILPKPKVDAEFLEAAKEVVALQTRLGVAAVTDGNLTWKDAFRGLVETTPGFQVGGVTRLFETNKFYRQPILVGEPRFDAKAFANHLLLEQIQPKATRKAILPGPYWFAKATKVETGNGAARAPEKIATLLNEAAKWLEGRGYREIQFNESLLFYEEEPDLKLAESVFKTVLSGLKSTTVANFPNGDAAPHLAWAQKLPATVLGVDFIETHIEELPKKKLSTGLQAAVVDSQESLLETTDEVESLVAAIEKQLAPPQFRLTHTWDFEFLPAPVAEKKLIVLADVAQRKVVA